MVSVTLWVMNIRNLNTDAPFGAVRPAARVVRAVGSDFLRRSLRPLVLIVAAVSVTLLLLGAWLVSRNAWWLLIELPLAFFSLALLGAFLFLRRVMRSIDPVTDKSDRKAVSEFTDTLLRTTENLRTPYPLILFRVATDVVMRRSGDDSFIASVAKDSTTLWPDFLALQRRLDGSRTFVEAERR